MIKLGLTGSIATGKSTTTKLFADEGVPVYDADAAVHAIYSAEGVMPVGTLIPGALIEGIVDRAALKAALTTDPGLFPKLEAIVHPLVQEREAEATRQAQAAGHDIMVFDVPLLFETGGEARMDKTVVVYCKPETQRDRLMARPGMTQKTAEMLMARQMSQMDKRARADFEISTDHGVEAAREQVRAIVSKLRA